MGKKLLKWLLMICMLLLWLSGCREVGSEQVSGDKTSEATVDVTSKAVGEEPDKTFAIVYPIVHPFFVATTSGAEDAAGGYNYELMTKGPISFNVDEQIKIMEDLIAMKVDGIGIGATDAIALKPYIDQAMAAGIPVVTFDTDSPLSSRLAFIGTDNKLQGHETGKVVADLIEGKGKVLVSMGVPSQLNLRLRLEGLMEELSEYPDIEIVDIQAGNGNPEQTSANIAAMVGAHPDFDVLVGIDAQAGPSAVPIWEEMALDQYLVVPEDMEATIQGVRDGIVTACIAQEQYEWGRLIVEALEKASEGKQLQTKYDTGIIVIDQNNVDEIYPEKLK